MPDFSVHREPPADDTHAWLLTVTGELDGATVDAFDAAVDEVVAHGARFVTLDLVGVTFLDSTGLRGVVHAANRIAAHDGKLTVAGLSGAAERVLEVTGLLERLREVPPTGDDDPGD